MKKIFIGVLALVAIGVLGLTFFVNTNKQTSEEVARKTSPAETPTFSWSFGEASTFNPDGLPQTHVYLFVNNEQTLIETVDGSCSEIADETYELDISNTGKVQCYYAGLGQQYRIVKMDGSYAVERKLFEEALPNVAMPEREWEVVKVIE